jgi:hypothetical protein
MDWLAHSRIPSLRLLFRDRPSAKDPQKGWTPVSAE